MPQTSRLHIPLLEAGQLQKEVTHNEALAMLDIVTAAAVTGRGTNSAPTNPALGECHIVGSIPTGAWSGHAHAIAGYTAGGWRFVAPVVGMRVLDRESATFTTFDGSAWTVAPGPIADCAGGDEKAKINAILAALRAQGVIAV